MSASKIFNAVLVQLTCGSTAGYQYAKITTTGINGPEYWLGLTMIVVALVFIFCSTHFNLFYNVEAE